MNELSFDIKNSRDFFLKLEEDYEEFCRSRTSSRIALNCALTAWHLTDWIYNEYKLLLLDTHPKFVDFQNWVKSQCESLQIMHDIANGTKHYLLTKHVPIVDKTAFHQGEFSDEFSREFNTSSLNIELKDGNKIYFEDEIEKAISYWREYLNLIAGKAKAFIEIK